MKDISTVEDIEKLVDKFYDKLMKDAATREKFEHLDLKVHLPKIVDFWAFILLDKAGYVSNVFEKHKHLNLEPIHFEHWLSLWNQTVGELFEGQKADLANQRAALLAFTFQSKTKEN